MHFLHLYEFVKLCSRKIWLFLVLNISMENGKVRKVFYEKNSDTAMLTACNQGKDLDWKSHISLGKGYG